MTRSAPVSLDALIIGGGVAGLWLLDTLRRAGCAALLIEKERLGAGQTVCAQGIIHGGLKYTLDGVRDRSGEAIRDAPRLWRERLSGDAAPDLRGVRVRADFCHLWRTSSLRSRFGALGARVALQVKPKKLPPGDWPAPLRGCPGEVYALAEPVIDPCSLLQTLVRANEGAVLRGQVQAADLGAPTPRVTIVEGGRELVVAARTVVITAGAGAEGLREQFGLASGAAQRRPLHMAMARGALPALNGHCADGARTRVTITTDQDSQGRVVWQIGGQVAEDGVKLPEPELLAHARRELADTIPGMSFDGLEWSGYRVDRAERRQGGGRRPDDACWMREGPVITAWPTKLALAPRLAEMLRRALPAPQGGPLDLSALGDWPRPEVAPPPWEEPRTWYRDP